MLRIQKVIFLVLVASTLGGTDEPEKLDSKDKSQATLANYNGNRDEPIDIQKTLRFAGKTTELLRYNTIENEKAILINTGYSVEVRLTQEETKLYVTGPAVGSYIFVYTRTIFYWTDSSNGVAATTIKGENGTPLEVSVLFYNTKYKTYFESLKHNDGIVEVRIRIHTDAPEDNEKFTEFAKKLESIAESGSTTEVDMSTHNSWYLNFPATEYYAYAGSMKNVSTGETYNSNIDVVIEKSLSISKNQFESSFLKLKTSSGEQLSTAQSQQPQDGRLVIYVNKPNFVKHDLDKTFSSKDGFQQT